MEIRYQKLYNIYTMKSGNIGMSFIEKTENTGRLKTIRVSDIVQEAEAGTVVFLITRIPGNLAKYVDGEKIRLCRQMSPSPELLKLKKQLQDSGKWNQETFDKQFVPRFAEEFALNREARAAMNEVFQLVLKGRNVALACFCNEEELCHRCIVKGFLQAVGVPSEGEDYSFYFLHFLAAEKKYGLRGRQNGKYKTIR